MSKFTELTDDELLNEIKAGNDGALNAYIERYRGFVGKIVAQFKNVPLEFDDLFQEGMIGLLAAIKSYNSDKGASFKTYAAVCIKNSVIIALNKINTQKSIPPDMIVHIDDVDPKSRYVVSAEDEYLASISVSALTDILQEKLSHFENEVLRLYIIGCSYNEIGEKLGNSPKSVDNAIQRIRKKLKGVTF
ncbi:MAG: sigma-70 family RNA polymerase sigma factor [Eubacterium sp.]|nr:sigma-70 family RNA polymerase sigma factor [Eubacterium sp.]